jgi:hypothetical protein
MTYYRQDDEGDPIRTENITEKDWNGTTRVVASDYVGVIHVSTVFLNIDHSFNSGTPVLWETMVFGGEHDGYQDRYTSVLEAMEGHGRVLHMVRESESSLWKKVKAKLGWKSHD